MVSFYIYANLKWTIYVQTVWNTNGILRKNRYLCIKQWSMTGHHYPIIDHYIFSFCCKNHLWRETNLLWPSIKEQMKKLAKMQPSENAKIAQLQTRETNAIKRNKIFVSQTFCFCFVTQQPQTLLFILNIKRLQNLF